MLSYDQRFESYGHWKLEEASVLDRSGYLVKFRVYAYFHWRTGGAMNTKVLENFIAFLTMGRTQNFDLEQRNYDQLKLNGLIRYDFFHFGLISSFFRFLTFVRLKGFRSSSYSCTCICNIMIYVGHIRSSPKERFCQIYMTYVSSVAVAVIPVVSSSETNLRNRG
jgi:hypothetical protein